MPGPPRTPTETRRAKGNPGKRPYNAREPRLPARAPPMPEGLDDIARVEWRRLADQALQAGVLTAADRPILELAAVAYSLWSQARLVLAQHGLAYETTNSNGDAVRKLLPETQVEADAWRRYRAAICELGFTPAARAKVSTVDPGENQDPAASYFN